LKTAINNGNFISWPGINTLSIDKHLPKSIDSAKGHLDQERKNLQSTKPRFAPDDKDEFLPISDAQNIKTFEACAAIVPFLAKNTAYHDLMGRFPHRSSRSNEYLLIVYDHDSNSILKCPLKNKTGAEINRGWTKIHERLEKGVNQPKLYILDNEASAELKKGWPNMDLLTSLFLLICIDEMLPNEQSELSRVIFSLVSPHAIQSSQFLSGIDYCFKLNSRSTFYALRE
jgi:hypothetical protein